MSVENSGHHVKSPDKSDEYCLKSLVTLEETLRNVHGKRSSVTLKLYCPAEAKENLLRLITIHVRTVDFKEEMLFTVALQADGEVMISHVNRSAEQWETSLFLDRVVIYIVC